MGSKETSASVAIQKRLSELSRDLVEAGQEVADESDRWFLATWRGIDWTTQRTKSELGRFGRFLGARLPKMPWNRGTPRQRLERTLRAEAKRQGLDVQSPAFSEFSDKMSSLLELVLTGAITFEAIGFESDEEALAPAEPGQTTEGAGEPSTPELSAAEPPTVEPETVEPPRTQGTTPATPLFELGKEVPDHQQRY